RLQGRYPMGVGSGSKAVKESGLVMTIFGRILGLFASILLFTAPFSTAQTAPVRIEFCEPHATAYLILQPVSGDSAKLSSTTDPEDLWIQATIEGTTNIVELGSRIVLQIKAG